MYIFTSVCLCSGGLSLHVAVEMTFDIKTIDSLAHCMLLLLACLLLGLSEIHVSLMWVEEDTTGHHMNTMHTLLVRYVHCD